MTLKEALTHAQVISLRHVHAVGQLYSTRPATAMRCQPSHAGGAKHDDETVANKSYMPRIDKL